MLATLDPGKEAAEKSLVAKSIKEKGKRPSSEAAVPSNRDGEEMTAKTTLRQTMLSRPVNSAFPLRQSGHSKEDETPVNITTHAYSCSLPRQETTHLQRIQPWFSLVKQQY